ncbi:hypothetical protein [Thalassolituus sp. UBA3500]|uniref:hypothetical protein n=1 Tax=Thalassolituus sp. UBA3500 TaxID=1947664 RepID=UPI000C0D105D|nr:hypothetical protein [Thalassolituus sp. UBA3500]MBN58761.1 hypothetical protein [Oceanospirillaceae bacterium]|tara:strand:+ start:1039 stop:2538 length:1500 start_codon:yes stop_codon:yes gene_type:complete
MAGGLSTESAVTGFAKGFSLGNAALDAKQNRELRADAAERDKKLFAMKEEEYDTQKQTADRKKLEAEMQKDLRTAYVTGKPLGSEFSEKYQSLGVGKFFDSQSRQESMKAGAIFKRAADTGNYEDPALLDAGNVILRDQLAAREAKDGLKRRIAGARRTKNGQVALELEVVGKDGKAYRAPMTKDGSSDANDQVILLDQDKFNNMATAALSQANTAYLAEKAGDDPKALADNLYYALFGSRLAPQSGQDGFEYKKGYDENGQEVLYQFDKKSGKYKAVGGSKAVDPKDQKQNQIDTKPLFDALIDIDTSPDYATEEDRQAARARVNQSAVALIGGTLDEIIYYQNIKAQNGDYSPLTRAEFIEMKAGGDRRLKDEEKRKEEEALAQQEQLSSARQNAVSLADSALEGSPLGAKAPPMPEEPAPEVETEPSEGAQQISEMTEKPRSEFRDRVARLNERKKQKQIASLREAAQKASSAQEVNAIAQQIVSLSDASASLDSF